MRPTPNCRSKNRGSQNFELLHNSLLTLFLDDTLYCVVLRCLIELLVLPEN
ncbi:unnamed protein product, partial [Callosobruchus maculatus]